MEWYIETFKVIVERLGRGFAARGISNAGHSLKSKLLDVQRSDGDLAIPWTVDGQVLHKCAYVDLLLEECKKMRHDRDGQQCDEIRRRTAMAASDVFPKLIFVSHSIGAHFTQRLCMLRPDLLKRTRLLIHLMPFIRMKAPGIIKQRILDFAGKHPNSLITIHEIIMKFLKTLPRAWVKGGMRQMIMPNDQACEVAVDLVRQPAFARNYLSLGTEEIRDVPENFDVRYVIA